MTYTVTPGGLHREAPESRPEIRWAVWLLWSIAAIYLAAVALLWLPSVHYYFDAVAIRDAGTVWSSLTWNPADKKHFLPAAVLLHPEGPLQFVMLNGYYALVGNVLPLKPSTTQLPNIALALWAGAMAALVGRQLHSRRFGLLWAGLLLGMPWLGVTLRLPWFFNILGIALQLTCLWSVLAWANAPQSRRAQAAAAVSVALFLTAAPDWPAFLAVLVVVYAMTGTLKAVTRNVYFLLPLGVILIHLAWTLAVYWYGAGDPLRQNLYRYTFLVYPFLKVGSSSPSVDRIAPFLWSTFGVALPCAAVGVGLLAVAWRRGRHAQPASPIGRGYALVMMLWLAGGLALLGWNAGSVTYGYVVAVPMAWCAAMWLVRTPTAVQVIVLAALLASQWSTGPLRAQASRRQAGDDRRVLAAAAFLNQNRPDLLAPGKTALLPRPHASNVGQYARGRNERIILPEDFPVTRRIHSVSSPEAVLRELVDTYVSSGELRADWLILNSELIEPSAAAPEFFTRLLNDPGISWIAQFPDTHHRTMWIGEVRRSGANVPFSSAPRYPVGALADAYEHTYDRIRFLRTNARHVDHY